MGEALVRVRAVLVGRAETGSGQDGTIPGRQFVGTVESVGTKTDAKRWEGKRVLVSPAAACGVCASCRSGLARLCPDRVVFGERGKNGGLAERVAVPIANLIEIHPKVADQAACLAFPLAVAVHATQVTRIEGRPFVTVLGDSTLALLTAQLMTRMNASVRVLGEHPARFGLCERWGIKHRHIMEAGRRRDQDVVVEVTGKPAMYEAAFGLLRPRGKLVAMPTDVADRGGGVNLGPAIDSEIEILGVSESTGSGLLSTALAILERGEVEIAGLVGRVFKLEQIDEALRAESSGGCAVVEIAPA